MEHMVMKKAAQRIIKKVVPGWEAVFNYQQGDKGRVWLLWNASVCDFTMIQVHEQFIHGLVRVYGSNECFNFTAVYGLHTIPDRKALWHELLTIANAKTIPWLTMGDFNAIMHIDDRLLGSAVQANEISDFANYMQEANIMELKAIGRAFTWTNNHVFSRIDRGLVNSSWIQTWSNLEVVVMEPEFSDHSPLCVTIGDRQTRVAKPFKFFNCMASHPDFQTIVQQEWYRGWHASTLPMVWRKLGRLKTELKKLNSTEFQGVADRITDLRNKLKVIQSQMGKVSDYHVLHDEEKTVRLELEKWHNIEESVLKQKSRVNWLN
ncbi:uncharacterized protein LOC132637696 [Lycium barbarum]|uniref:uncharacterized protein LOC132637696 n=1 Tax=Lycium barbarum TaxID=112863 RepID=UPI00293EFEB2|nr:uncharacterized protein LOC132637696 [Lycium barbarum]